MASMKKNRVIFNFFGIAVVVLWLFMIGFLVKKNNFNEPDNALNTEYKAPKIDSAQREWKEIYLKDSKVGYAINLVKPFEGGYFLQEEIFLKLNLMGLGGGVYTVIRSRVDKDFLLKNFQFAMTSGAVSYRLSGRVEKDELIIETGKGNDRRDQRIKLVRKPMIGAGIGHFFRSKRLSIGETFKLPMFDPSTMAQKEIIIRVTAKEKVNIRRVSYDAYRLETELWGKILTFWVDENGTTLKEQGFMGLTTIKSSAARAPRDLEREGDIDFYDMTAVSVEKPLHHPRRLTYLKMKLGGIDHMRTGLEILNNERQRFEDGVMEITLEKPPYKSTYLLPYNDFNDDLQAFIKPEFNIESDNETIVRQAKRIGGNKKRPLAVARKLMNWVFLNLEKRPVVSVPSALEVLQTKVGDCNEHATLLTALLRASGIPARLGVGLVYTRDKFFYHAWTEAYVGRWISMDATLNQMPADATHIKLVEGNLDKQVEIAGFIGTMKIEIMDFKK